MESIRFHNISIELRGDIRLNNKKNRTGAYQLFLKSVGSFAFYFPIFNSESTEAVISVALLPVVSVSP